MPYDPQKHHRRSMRLRGYDYSRPGAYFVTICTKDGAMLLAHEPLQRIVLRCWEDLPHHYPNIVLDQFIVMPNHVHGIIMFTGDAAVGVDAVGVDAVGVGAVGVGAVGVGAVGVGFKPTPTIRHPLSEIVRAFKTFSARRINDLQGTSGVPVWQRNYYERIIRDEEALHRIREYIATNPLRWHLDRENPDRTGSDDFDHWLDQHSRPAGAGQGGL